MTTTEPDYSVYRKQLKSLDPSKTEQEIYQWYRGVIKPGKNVQTHEFIGDDGFYHFVYITVCENDGTIYIGKHSTKDLNDGYQGSGSIVQDGKNKGMKYTTTPLEFFESSDDAYIAEKSLVNQNFLRSPLVMNRELGGKTETTIAPASKQYTAPSASVVSSKKTPYRESGKKFKGDPFSALGVSIGDWVEFDEDTSKKYKVVNEWKVELNGRAVYLKEVLANLTSTVYKNPLNAFSHKGKNLGDVQRKLHSRK